MFSLSKSRQMYMNLMEMRYFRAMFFQGKVIHGLQNGRKFGFPTANVLLDHAARIDQGVYAVKVWLDGDEYGGMLYVGTRPTLELEELSVEIHIFDFDGDIYGKEISFELVRKIREEQKFSSLEELITQLGKDREEVRRYVP